MDVHPQHYQGIEVDLLAKLPCARCNISANNALLLHWITSRLPTKLGSATQPRQRENERARPGPIESTVGRSTDTPTAGCTDSSVRARQRVHSGIPVTTPSDSFCSSATVLPTVRRAPVMSLFHRLLLMCGPNIFIPWVETWVSPQPRSSELASAQRMGELDFPHVDPSMDSPLAGLASSCIHLGLTHSLRQVKS